MRFGLVLLILAIALPAGAAKKRYAWQEAKVIDEAHEFRNNDLRGPSAASGSIAGLQQVRQRLEIETANFHYALDRITLRSHYTPIPKGAELLVAEDGKELVLRLGREQAKFKIVDKTPRKAK